VHTRCVIATAHAARRAGGYGGQRPRPAECTHDLHVSALYLELRRTVPELAATWIHEAEIFRTRPGGVGKVPDALVRLPLGTKVIEFGGAYGAQKLAAFHRYCAQEGLPYEIW
jgi:hypothetical protein